MSKKQFVSVCLTPEQKQLVSQAAKKTGVSQSEFIRRVILSAAEDALEAGSTFGRNAPSAGAELIITEQGQARLTRDLLAMKTMVQRLYGEMVTAKAGSQELAIQDIQRVHESVEEIVTEHGLVFE